jgi:hypothetical protein
MPFTISGVALMGTVAPAEPAAGANRLAQASDRVWTFEELICVSGLKRRPE